MNFGVATEGSFGKGKGALNDDDVRRLYVAVSYDLDVSKESS